MWRELDKIFLESRVLASNLDGIPDRMEAQSKFLFCVCGLSCSFTHHSHVLQNYAVFLLINQHF